MRLYMYTRVCACAWRSKEARQQPTDLHVGGAVVRGVGHRVVRLLEEGHGGGDGVVHQLLQHDVAVWRENGREGGWISQLVGFVRVGSSFPSGGQIDLFYLYACKAFHQSVNQRNAPGVQPRTLAVTHERVVGAVRAGLHREHRLGGLPVEVALAVHLCCWIGEWGYVRVCMSVTACNRCLDRSNDPAQFQPPQPAPAAPPHAHTHKRTWLVTSEQTRE